MKCNQVSLLVTLASLLVFVTPPLAHAQHGTLEGTVRGGDTGESLPGANVTIESTNLGTSTDSDGAFRLENVPVGSYTVRISFVGYNIEQREVSIQDGQTATLNVVLPLSSQEFDEVVVTGSRQQESVGEAPVQMEVVTEDDIRTLPGETLLSTLATQKGIDYSRTGLNQQSISMRGFDSHYNARLVQMKDGHLAQAPGTGLPQGTITPTSELDVRQIEVVVGPASALYGPNAHTGVVNILTKTPWDESGITLDVQGGQQDLLDVNGRVAGTIAEDFGWKISGEYMSGTDYKPPRGGPNAQPRDSTHYFGTSFNEIDLVENYHISTMRSEGSLYYRFGNTWQIRGDYGFSLNDNLETTTFGRIRLRGYQLQYQNLELSSDNWKFRATHTANEGGDSYTLEGLASISETAYQTALAQGVPPDQAYQQTLDQLPAYRDSTRFTFQGEMWDAEAQYKTTFNVGLGTLHLVTGAQFQRYLPSSNETYLADAIDRDISATEQGAYLQLDYRPTESLRINTATRVDQHTRYDRQISPKAAVVYSFNRNQRLRFSYNRAFKSPEIFHHHFYIGPLRGNTGGFTIRNGPTSNADVVQEIAPLSPEEVNSIEAEYRGVFWDDVSLNLVAYNSRYTNFISPLTVVASPAPELHPTASQPTFAFQDGELVDQRGLLTYYNFGEATVQGIDLGLGYSFGQKVSLSSSLSLINMAEAEKNAFTPPLLLNVPTTKVKGSMMIRDLGIDNYFIRLTGRWKSSHDFRVGYWDSERFFGEGGIPSRYSVGMTVGYTVPQTGLELKASGTNLLDTRIPDKLGAPQTGRFLSFSASYRLEGLKL